MAGGPLDVDEMEQKLGEIDVLHKEWMDLAAHFVPIRKAGRQVGRTQG
jgi:hypothetical protein